MRRRFAYATSLHSTEEAAFVPDSGGSLLTDLKLFGLTYVAGFVAVSLFIA